MIKALSWFVCQRSVKLRILRQIFDIYVHKANHYIHITCTRKYKFASVFSYVPTRFNIHVKNYAKKWKTY